MTANESRDDDDDREFYGEEALTVRQFRQLKTKAVLSMEDEQFSSFGDIVYYGVVYRGYNGEPIFVPSGGPPAKFVATTKEGKLLQETDFNKICNLVKKHGPCVNVPK